MLYNQVQDVCRKHFQKRRLVFKFSLPPLTKELSKRKGARRVEYWNLMCLVNSQDIEIENYKISSMAER